MCLLLRGRLGIRVRDPDATETKVNEMGPGAIVGEMALTRSQARLATVYALEECELVRLSRAGFERVLARYPQLMNKLAQAIVARMRRLQLAGVLKNLFGQLDVVALDALQAQLEWLHLKGGETVFRQGDSGDWMVLVVNGRLRIVKETPDGGEQILGEVSRGNSVCQFAVLTGETRSATVYAVRDSDVVKLSHDVFEHLVDQYPRAVLQIVRSIAKVGQQMGSGSPRDGTVTINFVLVPTSQSSLPSDFGQRLADTMETFGPTLHLTSESFDRHFGKEGASQTQPDDPIDMVLVSWIGEQERTYRYVVFEADPTWSPWTQRCVRQADRLILVGQADGDPGRGEIEAAIERLGLRARRELVLLHPVDTERPKGTAAWLAPRRLHTHHHVRLGDDEHLRRLTRRLVGRAFGLGLGGGGARGFCHLGVISAIEEAGIEVDLVGGTSMGSVLSAMFVMGWDSESLVKLAERLASPKELLDYTFPAASVFATKKVSSLLVDLFGDTQIEDLWRPYFCVSADLSHAAPVVHRDGPLWRAVRSSLAVPGLFAPESHEGHLLVDGGLINNLPIDVMRDLCGSSDVIAVNASPREEQHREWEFGTNISGWRVLWRKLNPFSTPLEVPSLAITLLRSLEVNSTFYLHTVQDLADLLFEPRTKEFGILDWTSYEGIVDIGYRTAKP